MNSSTFRNLPQVLAFTGLAAIASLATAADERSGTPAGTAPVLRSYEPAESVVFRLPTPPAAPPAAEVPAPKALPIAPVAPPLTSPAKPVLTSSIPPPAARPKPVEAPVKPALPAEVTQDVAFYCQKRVGQWTEADARKLLGAPLRSRPAYDENRAVNGKIYAFHDPTGRYRELELDFDGKAGVLRTVFGYPPKLSWQEVHHRWTGEVNAADAQRGRKFYSYANRRMDVLVDAQGRVISLGLY